MTTTALTIRPTIQARTSGFTYTPQIEDHDYFAWLDARCGDGFNRLVVRLFGPA